MKLLEDNIGVNLDDLGYGWCLFQYNTKDLKEIVDKLDFIKIKNFFSVKDKIKCIRKSTDWEKYLQKACLIKDYYPEYTKNS